jgi:hypothetical protein
MTLFLYPFPHFSGWCAPQHANGFKLNATASKFSVTAIKAQRLGTYHPSVLRLGVSVLLYVSLPPRKSAMGLFSERLVRFDVYTLVKHAAMSHAPSRDYS